MIKLSLQIISLVQRWLKAFNTNHRLVFLVFGIDACIEMHSLTDIKINFYKSFVRRVKSSFLVSVINLISFGPNLCFESSKVVRK